MGRRCVQYNHYLRHLKFSIPTVVIQLNHMTAQHDIKSHCQHINDNLSSKLTLFVAIKSACTVHKHRLDHQMTAVLAASSEFPVHYHNN